jgi:hypothetical protein
MWLVVGAGPSGLAVASALLEQGTPFVVYETLQQPGGLWSTTEAASPIYEGARLITSVEMTRFQGFPWQPESGATYPDRREVLAYLQEYAVFSGTTPYVEYGVRVSGLYYDPTEQLWTVLTNRGVKAGFEAVVLCCGAQWEPRSAATDGPAIFANALRDPKSECAGRPVLVIGGGNTATDIACLASETASQVTLEPRCSRWVIPKFIDGTPSDYPLPDGARIPLIGRRGMTMQLELRDLLTSHWLDLQDVWPRPGHLPFQRALMISDELLPRIKTGVIAVHVDGDGKSTMGEQKALRVIANGYDETIPLLVDGRKIVWSDFLLNCVHRIFPTLFAVRPPRSDIGGFWILEYLGGLIALASSKLRYSRSKWYEVWDQITSFRFDLLEGALVQQSTDSSAFVVGSCYLDALSRLFVVLGAVDTECRLPAPKQERRGV